MKAALLAVLLAACGSDHGTTTNPDAGPGIDAPVVDTTPFDKCDGDAASFVRQTFLALDGRRPLSQAEVDVYVDLYKQSADDKTAVATAIMARPEFTERWVDVAMDALHVQRIDYQSEEACWDKPLRANVDTSLAQQVRDTNADAAISGGTWGMLDLARSAIALDDLSPVWRAQLFSLVSHEIPAANVDDVTAELARREDFGQTFDAAYLHRDIVCLGCHTSQRSVTDNDDPAVDRFWPAPGLPEGPVFGAASGEDLAAAHAAFRFQGFVRNGSSRAWGWTSNCGLFAAKGTVFADPANVSAKLASVTGKTATVRDLEAALKRGFDALRAGAPTAAITDPDTALAWLVTLQMTETVYKQVIGTGLTIANYFPRNEASADLLTALATTFATHNYSLKALLVAIVKTPYFNRAPAEKACGSSPYTYPAVFDPWVIADADPAKHKNGPGDAVTAVDGRTLISATNAALGWALAPNATRFPVDDEAQGGTAGSELTFERGVGLFLRNSERGFRGLDFGGLLTWEDRYGVCTRPSWVSADFIDQLVSTGAATATMADAVKALKDRLLGEPALDGGAETAALAAITGGLDRLLTASDGTVLRQVCGALVGSPQFLLQGIAGRGGERPKLTPVAADYPAVCAQVAATLTNATCASGTLVLQP